MTSPYDTVPGKIFIGGIPPSTTQETLQRYFAQFGELSDCVLMQDKTTGKSRGFGFVTFRDGKALEDVLKLQHVIDGKELDCKKAIRREQQLQENSAKEEVSNTQTKKIFIGGLLQTTTDDELRAYFEQFGPLEDSVIMVDKVTGKSRGFGFVTFVSEDSVNLVIQQYYENKIGGKWVECKRAQPKETHRKGAHNHGNKDQTRFNKVQNPGGKDPHANGIVSSSQRYPRNHGTQNNFGSIPSPSSLPHFQDGGYTFQNNFPQNPAKNAFEPEYTQEQAFQMGTNFGGYPSQGFNATSPYDKPGYPVYPQNSSLPGNFPGNNQPNYPNLYQGVYNPTSNGFPQYPSGGVPYQQGFGNSPPLGPSSTPIQSMSENLQGGKIQNSFVGKKNKTKGIINPNFKVKHPYQAGNAGFSGEAGYGYGVQNNAKLNPAESLFEGKMNFMGFNPTPQMNFPPKEQFSSEQFDNRGPQYGISTFPMAAVSDNSYDQSSVGLIKAVRNPIVEAQNVQSDVFNLENMLQ